MLVPSDFLLAEFPVKISRALRGAIAIRKRDKEPEFIHAIFCANCEQGGASVAEYTALRRIAANIGADPNECENDEVRQALIDSTYTALERGVLVHPQLLLATSYIGTRTEWISLRTS